jgi:hypothetical protein
VACLVARDGLRWWGLWFVVLCCVFGPLFTGLLECCVVSWVVAGNVGVCDHVVVCGRGFGAALLFVCLLFLLGLSLTVAIREEGGGVSCV